MFDTLQEFLATSQDSLNQMDLDVITLEQAPLDSNALSSLSAFIHSVKAAARVHGLSTLESVARAGDGLLGKLRSEQVSPDKQTSKLLFDLADGIRALIELAASSSDTSEADFRELISTLEQTTARAGVEQFVKNLDAEPDDEPVVQELDDEMKEVLKDFLQESYENLDRVGSELIELEEQPGNRDLLSSIFRSMHTIKGTCGFFGFDKLEKVTHIGENLLVKLRDGEYSITEEIATALLSMVDAVRAMLDEISEHGHDGRERYASLIRQLSELKDHGKALHADAATSAVEVTPANEVTPVIATPVVVAIGPQAHIFVEDDDIAADKQDKPTAAVTRSVPDKQSKSSDAAATETGKYDEQVSEKAIANIVEASIRVDVPVLDALMNLVGELVLARNQIVEYVGTHENTQLVAAAQRLNLITSELQEGVMQTRMQPIHSIWAKLPRVVRDLSRSCGKHIRVDMEGKYTELDKSLIEAMKDPITHLIRNAVDHGIESPRQRIAAGKSAEGVLLLRAFHEGGQVHIEISDDGGGIPPERIKQKALDKGVISVEQAASMSDQEICRLVFLPGLSTAEKVTNISGRGVGMDVVKTNIEKISGAIDLDSVVGRGTIFKIRVPLTLAIVPALIVSTSKQRFAIPQVNLIELIRIDEEAQSRAIEYIHGCPVHRLRGQLLPLVYLHKELKLAAPEPGALNIVVLQAEKCRFGLVVDQINDTQEIVVKPLTEALKNIPVFAGATIMGDGRVALILDTLGIGQRARVMGEGSGRTVSLAAAGGTEQAGKSETLLLVSMSSRGRLAIPLNRVARLEQFDKKQTESVGDTSVVQYRGQILPLVQLCDFLHERRAGYGEEDNSDELIQVVVFGDEGRQIGLIVSEIIDVVDEVLTIRGKASRVGVLGTAAIQGQVTELFDVSEFVSATAGLLVELKEAV